MLSGDFQKAVKKLNSKLQICSMDNSKNAAGIYYIDPFEGYMAICGVDKNYVPERTEVDEIGHILKSGWRRVVNILLARQLTTREKVKEVWPSYFEQHVPAATFSNDDPIQKQISKYETDEENKRGVRGLNADQMLEIAEEVRKKDTDAKKEQADKDKWELEKALDVDQTLYI